MNDHEFTASPAFDLYPLLTGVSMPSSTDDLVRAAAAAGGDANAVETLRRLPPRRWDSVEEAVLTATTGWQAGELDSP